MTKGLQTATYKCQIRLQGFIYGKRENLSPKLGAAVAAAGGWVLERRPISAGALEFLVEVQSAALPGVYGALLASGLHLTRDSHHALAERCNCDLYLRPRRDTPSYRLLNLEVHFLPEPPASMDLQDLLPLDGLLN
ncbi:hypothetical protein [Terriglobus roseus]|uniref:Uncharacterized protein n=1 Tax=Terriglobus roseus TaxID=392734 RepID=A0A1H4KN73_9BACT|nr:hypothetical protein [Terriglobus roseus]SEB59927.1 hypothetical protein SAMN05443244_1279 [Terriglobus roseus]